MRKGNAENLFKEIRNKVSSCFNLSPFEEIHILDDYDSLTLSITDSARTKVEQIKEYIEDDAYIRDRLRRNNVRSEVTKGPRYYQVTFEVSVE